MHLCFFPEKNADAHGAWSAVDGRVWIELKSKAAPNPLKFWPLMPEIQLLVAAR
jgi:hypothetical protein